MKPKKWGILLRVLCDSDTKLKNDFKIYRGWEEWGIGPKILDVS